MRFPHLSAVVLDTDLGSAPLPDGWTAVGSLSGSLDDREVISVATPALHAPIRNLLPGQEFTATLPTPPDRIVALAFGSLTNRLWLETATDHLWLVNHDRGPHLDDWIAEMGTNPTVHRYRLVVEAGSLSLDPIESILLSELEERDDPR